MMAGGSDGGTRYYTFNLAYPPTAYTAERKQFPPRRHEQKTRLPGRQPGRPRAPRGKKKDRSYTMLVNKQHPILGIRSGDLTVPDIPFLH